MRDGQKIFFLQKEMNNFTVNFHCFKIALDDHIRFVNASLNVKSKIPVWH